MNINEQSTNEQILTALYDDGYAEHSENICTYIRENARNGTLVWTKHHVVGTCRAYAFELTKWGSADKETLKGDVIL